MTLDVIGDIANPSLTDNTSRDLTWETASDWDNAVDEETVVHETYGDVQAGADVVRLGYPTTSEFSGVNLLHFWSFHDSSGPITDHAGGWDATVVDPDGDDVNLDTVGPLGDTCAEVLNEATGGNGGKAYFDTENNLDLTADYTFLALTYDTGNNQEHQLLATYNGDGFIWRRTSSWQLWPGSTVESPTQNAWIVKAVTFDESASTDEHYTDGTSGGSDSADPISNSNTVKMFDRGDDAYPSNGKIQCVRIYDALLSDSQVAAISDPKSGYLETATKSYNSAQTPDFTNLSYNLNAGSITLKAIGSPGTASEEVQSVNLDGTQTSADLTWSSSHTDFHVRIEPSITSTTDATPTFSAATLSG